MKASDNEFPSILLDDQGSAPATPAAGFSRVFSKSDGLYIVDDAGSVTGPFGAAVTAGRQHIAAALGMPAPVATNNTTPAASAAYAQPIQINAPMLLRELEAHMQAAALELRSNRPHW